MPTFQLFKWQMHFALSSAALLLAGCDNEPDIPMNAEQSHVEQDRTGSYRAYKDAANEIQESAIFKQADDASNAAIKGAGEFAMGWSGKVDAITTTQGGSSARAAIRSTNNVVYESNEDITGGTPVFQQLASLKEGARVTFSGKFIARADGRFEESLTERGSLEEPEFRMLFTSIVPAGTTEPAFAHVVPTETAAGKVTDAKSNLEDSDAGSIAACNTPLLSSGVHCEVVRWATARGETENKYVKRVGTTRENLESLVAAAEMNGATAADALQSVENFSNAMKDPGKRKLAQCIGVNLQTAGGEAIEGKPNDVECQQILHKYGLNDWKQP